MIVNRISGRWHIRYNPKAIPFRTHDYDYYHDDWDGAYDSKDNRIGSASSISECMEQIQEWEFYNYEPDYYLCSSCQGSFDYSNLGEMNGGLLCGNCWPKFGE